MYRRFIKPAVVLLCVSPCAFSIELPMRYKNVGELHGVPAKLLLAIGLTESYWSKKEKIEPWPWTLNIAGSGRFYDSKEELLDDFSKALFNGRRSIDVGAMQINLRYHHRRFHQVVDMVQPVDNLNTAAIILLENRKVCQGDWWCAVGAYHSSHPERARRYVGRVKTWLEKIM